MKIVFIGETRWINVDLLTFLKAVGDRGQPHGLN